MGTAAATPLACLAVLLAGVALGGGSAQAAERGTPILHKKIPVPRALLAQGEHQGQALRYGGDIRIGDLTGDGRADFLVFRTAGAGVKPCFLAAFSMDGEILWRAGEGGGQPVRPGPVAVHDLDGDGAAEVLSFFTDPRAQAPPHSLADVSVQVRDGATAKVEAQAAPPELRACQGRGPNWVHQRLLVANFQGGPRPRDFAVKLGEKVLAFSHDLRLLWTYSIRWNDYSRCSAYIPAVGDIDGDGRDELFGGYYLLDHDGTPLWEKQLGRHMDSVAVAPWDGGRVRALGSGHGVVLDARGRALLELGPQAVPHGQELRVADFLAEPPGPEMVIRYRGHAPDVMTVATDGRVLRRWRLNSSPNETGMEVVYWDGPDRPALVYNGGELWHATGRRLAALPGLPPPVGPPRMGWYHGIPADLCGDRREEAVVYNPWDRFVAVYTPAPLDPAAYRGYRPGPRQYNPRLMD